MNVMEIKVHMTRANMNITSLAKSINVSPATVARWFSAGDMPISKAKNIIEVLGIPKHNAAAIFFS